MDYDSTPWNWTLKLFREALHVDQEALNLLFADVRQFFSNKTDITELMTHASKKRISAEAKTIRARVNDLLANVPAGSKFDKECVEGSMKCIFNNSSSSRAKLNAIPPGQIAPLLPLKMSLRLSSPKF